MKAHIVCVWGGEGKGGGRGRGLDCQLCTDALKKKDEKGYFFHLLFFRAGQCAALSSFRVGKCYVWGERVAYVFTNLTQDCEISE